MAKNIYVGNLVWDATADDLLELFEKHGKVTRAQVITDKETGRSRGFGFVEMENDSEAQKAIEALPGVGPTLAKRIMEARPFQSLDDLSKIKGMTKTKVAALKDKVTVGPAAPAAPAPAAQKPVPAPAPAAGPQPATAAKEKAEAGKLAPGERININTATAEELDKLPDIGPVKAQAIIEGRPYKTPEDIMKVRGIKEGIYNKIKDHISVQ